MAVSFLGLEVSEPSSFSLFLVSILHAQVSPTLNKQTNKTSPSNLQVSMFPSFSFAVLDKFFPPFLSPLLFTSLNLDFYFALHWNGFPISPRCPMSLKHILVTISWPLSIMWHDWPVSPSWNSHVLGFPHGSVVKNLPANAGDTGSIPDPGRSHRPPSN